MFMSESHLLETTLCVGVVLVLLFHWLNVTIMTDFYKASWNFFTSFVPGENHDRILLALILTVTLLICWMFSSTVVVFSVLIVSVHLLDFPFVTESFKSGWNQFLLVVRGFDHAKILVPSSLTIMMFLCGSLSSAVLVFSILILSVHLLNFTVVTDFLESGWKYVMSVGQGENLTKSLGETTQRIKVLVFESNPLVRMFLVFGVLMLLLHWLNFTIFTEVFTSGWNVFKFIIAGLGLVETITVFLFGSFSSTLMVFSVVIVSIHFLNITVVTDSFRSCWKYIISVSQGENLTTSSEETTLGNPLVRTFLVVMVSVVLLHWLNFTMVTDFFTSGWNVLKSVIPGLGLVETITVFLFGSLSSTLLVFSVVIVSIHLLNITVVTDSFRSGWKHFKSMSSRENLTKCLEETTQRIKVLVFESNPLVRTFLVFGILMLLLHWLNFTIFTEVFIAGWNVFKFIIPGLGLVETTTVFLFGSFSSTLLVFSVVIVSIHLLNITVVTDSFRSCWKYIISVSQGENLTKSSEETTLGNPLVRTFLVVMVSVVLLHWLNFTMVTDLFTSGWNVFKSVIPGLGLVETTTVLVFGSFSSTLLVFSVLLVSVHLLNMIIVTDSFRSGWNRFISVIPGSGRAKTLGALTITILVVGSISSTFVVLGILIFSVRFVNVTVVTNSFRSGWHRFRSVIHVYVSEGNETKLLANAVREKSSLLPPQTGSVPVYKIPLREKQININGCRYFSFGKKSTKPNRTIVVLGAADSGKSAVISGMVNHILGVEWADSYRFKLVEEVQSVHGEVTVYKIYHQKGFRIDYSLTIVDTPGFGDTRGVERGREITEQLRNVFYSLHDVGEIDSVCFVAQAALTQLTTTQKYVFDSVLSIFGKDVAENIRILVTSADDQLPPVLEAIKASGVPCPKAEDGLPVHFRFNTSALFADNSRTNGHQVFWTMGTNNMRSFFAALHHMKTLRLTLTSEVLGDRNQVESSVENLQKQVKLGLAKLEKIRETIEKLKDHEAEISTNENFEFYVVVKKPVKVDMKHAQHFYTNCQQCQVTCHFHCNVPNDDKNRDGCCNVCPGKCFWNVHFNQKFKWVYKDIKEKQTVKELKENYEEAVEQKVTSQGLIEELKAEYEDVQNKVMKVIEVSAKCLNRLKEIGHASHSLSTLEYIDMLIGGEKKEAKAGWARRVERLMEVREKAENKGEGPQ